MKDIRIELIYAVPLTTNVIDFYTLQFITNLNLCCTFFSIFIFSGANQLTSKAPLKLGSELYFHLFSDVEHSFFSQ